MKLTAKVFLSMAVIIGVALLVVAILVGRSANQAYRGYLTTSRLTQLQRIADQAAQLYAETGSWPQVQAWVDQFGTPFFGPRMQRQGRLAPAGRAGATDRPPRPDRLVIVDPESGAGLGIEGLQVDPAQAESGVPITLNDQEIARLVLVSDRQPFGPEEQALLGEIQRAIVIAAGVAALLALIIGGLLVFSILRPLAKLEEGVAQVAQGDLTTQVQIDSDDEVGKLAAAFNQMTLNLQRQEELRQHMVADIAHDLRTPLSVIQGNLQAILDGVYPLDRSEIQTVYDETQLLGRLVNDLHELAQAEAGQLPLAFQSMRVIDVLTQMANAFQGMAAQNQIAIEVTPPPPDLQVMADPDRLQQILHNLLGNAVHHTPPGGTIHLSARLVDRISSRQPLNVPTLTSHDYTKYIRFQVKDTGPGIPPESLPHVFDRFYRGDPSRAQPGDGNSAGSGLGLAIAKALVELHGGQIGVESTPGQGSLFWFELPATNTTGESAS